MKKYNFIILIVICYLLLMCYISKKILAEEISPILQFKEDCIKFYTPFLKKTSQTIEFMKEYCLVVLVDKETGVETVMVTQFYMDEIHNEKIIKEFWLSRSAQYWDFLFENNQQINVNYEITFDKKKLWYLISQDFNSFVKNKQLLMERKLMTTANIENTKIIIINFLNQLVDNMSYYRSKHLGSSVFINNFIEQIEWEEYMKTWDCASKNFGYIKNKYLTTPHNNYYFFEFIKDLTVSTYENTIKNSKEIILPLVITNIIFFCYLFGPDIDMYLNLNNALVLYYDIEFLTPSVAQFNYYEKLKTFIEFFFVNVVCYFLYKNNNNEIKNISTTLNQDFNSYFEYVNNKYFYNFIFYIIILIIITFYPFRYYYLYKIKNDK